MKTNLFKVRKIGLASLLFVVGLSFLNVSFADAKENTKNDFARGAKAWVDNCVRCHNVCYPKELRDDQ